MASYVLDESDRAVLQRLASRILREPQNTTNRQGVFDDPPSITECYLALTPMQGIPALSNVGTGTGSGSGTGTDQPACLDLLGSVPGGAMCNIYCAQVNTAGTPQMVLMSSTVIPVYNCFQNVIPGCTLVPVVRDKHGQWWVTTPNTSVAFTAVLTDCATKIVRTTLATAITSTPTTSIEVESTEGFPTTVPFDIAVGLPLGYEITGYGGAIMTVTAISGTTWTVTSVSTPNPIPLAATVVLHDPRTVVAGALVTVDGIPGDFLDSSGRLQTTTGQLPTVYPYFVKIDGEVIQVIGLSGSGPLLEGLNGQWGTPGVDHDPGSIVQLLGPGPYSWSAASPAGDGTWQPTSGGQSGAFNAYDLSGLQQLPIDGTMVVVLRQCNQDGTWQFDDSRPLATITQAGIVSLGDQTLGRGVKTVDGLSFCWKPGFSETAELLPFPTDSTEEFTGIIARSLFVGGSGETGLTWFGDLGVSTELPYDLDTMSTVFLQGTLSWIYTASPIYSYGAGDGRSSSITAGYIAGLGPQLDADSPVSGLASTNPYVTFSCIGYLNAFVGFSVGSGAVGDAFALGIGAANGGTLYPWGGTHQGGILIATSNNFNYSGTGYVGGMFTANNAVQLGIAGAGIAISALGATQIGAVGAGIAVTALGAVQLGASGAGIQVSPTGVTQIGGTNGPSIATSGIMTLATGSLNYQAGKLNPANP